MERVVGLWIDHHQAIIVRLDARGSTIEHFMSGVEPRVRMSGGSRSRTRYGPQEVASESGRDARYAKHLNVYYDQVIEAIADAEAILIMGPGEAKREFQTRVDRRKALSRRIRDVETRDKMTDRQIRARVQDYFRQKPDRPEG